MAAVVGERLWAQDRHKGWYLARVLNEKGEGDDRRVLVHFFGYGKAQDEWVKPGERTRPLPNGREEWDWGDETGRIDEGIYEVDKVLKRRRLSNGVEQALVRWVGWDAGLGEGWDDSWEEAEDVAPELLEGIEVEEVVQQSVKEPYVLGYLNKKTFFDDVSAAAAARVAISLSWEQRSTGLEGLSLAWTADMCAPVPT